MAEKKFHADVQVQQQEHQVPIFLLPSLLVEALPCEHRGGIKSLEALRLEEGPGIPAASSGDGVGALRLVSGGWGGEAGWSWVRVGGGGA